MPYRGAIGPRSACALHAAAEAVEECTACRAPLCDPCTLYFSAEPYCRECIIAARRVATIQLGARVALVVILLAGASWLGLAGARAHIANARQFSTALQATRAVRCLPEDR